MERRLCWRVLQFQEGFRDPVTWEVANRDSSEVKRFRVWPREHLRSPGSKQWKQKWAVHWTVMWVRRVHTCPRHRALQTDWSCLPCDSTDSVACGLCDYCIVVPLALGAQFVLVITTWRYTPQDFPKLLLKLFSSLVPCVPCHPFVFLLD